MSSSRLLLTDEQHNDGFVRQPVTIVFVIAGVAVHFQGDSFFVFGVHSYMISYRTTTKKKTRKIQITKHDTNDRSFVHSGFFVDITAVQI